MTDDERMEFLRQSIESHDRQIGELTESVAKTDAQLARTDAQLAAFIETTQINFDRLTKAMMGLVEHATNHSRRLEKLENQA